MKTAIKTTSLGRKLGLITLVVTLLSGIAASAQLGLIVNETFDPPTLIPLEGFQSSSGVADVSREYVSEGVKDSTAAKISVTFTAAGGYVVTYLYYNGVVMANDRATPESTVLSLDLKVDQPGLTDLYVSLNSLSLYHWEGSEANSWGYIPLGSYTPGKFQTVVVPLDNPIWNASADGPFDPSGKTYQIAVGLGGWFMPPLGPLTVTIDNLRLSTSNFMLPWKLTPTGQMTVDWLTGAATASEAGSSSHLGDYTSVIKFDNLFADTVTGSAELTADNGDKLFGRAYGLSWEPAQFGIVIESGSGRFAGAKGTYIETLTWTEFLSSFTATATGNLSTVGSNK